MWIYSKTHMIVISDQQFLSAVTSTMTSSGMVRPTISPWRPTNPAPTVDTHRDTENAKRTLTRRCWVHMRKKCLALHVSDNDWLFGLLFPIIAATPDTCGSGSRPASKPGPALSSPALNLFDPNFLEKQTAVDNNDNAEKETTGGSPQGGPLDPFIPKCPDGLRLLCCVVTYPRDGTASICTTCKFTACFLSMFKSEKNW